MPRWNPGVAGGLFFKCGHFRVHWALFDRAPGVRSKSAQYFPRVETCGSAAITLQSDHNVRGRLVQTPITLQSDRAGPTNFGAQEILGTF